MTPGQASAKGKILIIDHPDGGRRVAAHVFDMPGGGVVFMDSGWTDPLGASHPGHLVAAEFMPFDQGWGAIDAEGRDVFIELYPGSPAEEGDRNQARAILESDLQIKIPPDRPGRRANP